MTSCRERDKFTRDFWRYYMVLEEDGIRLRRYVDFRTTNFKTSSDEIIKQLISVSAEFDNICKEMTNIKKKKPNIADYAKWFFREEKFGKELSRAKVVVRDSEIELSPFAGWNAEGLGLKWWRSYNNVKHHRTKKYDNGNLRSLLNALAALYYLECLQYRRIALNYPDGDVFDIPPDLSRLFYVKMPGPKAVQLGENLFAIKVGEIDDGSQ